MTVFNAASFDDHEQVVFCNDSQSGLRAIIAIHNTNLGPAAGGCRMWPYSSDDEALHDVLRLSRGMSYKNAMAGLPLGGGKSVIIADPKRGKTPELLRAFGKFIEGLSGKYITAEDVGVSVADMEIVAQETSYVAGLSLGNSASGDPSPFTAHGVFVGLKAAVKQRLGRSDLTGLRVAVQGVGNVGYHLCHELHEAGAKLYVADISPDNLARAVRDFGAEVVPVDQIHGTEVDVFAPCALGGVINDITIPELKASVIAGGANNQLATPRHGTELLARNILFAPDYVINAGGIINVAGEVTGDYDVVRVRARIERIADTVADIFQVAQKKGLATNLVADSMAREEIEKGRSANRPQNRLEEPARKAI